ncbi:MAG: serine/threonine protein kinase [Rhodocyclales bacterium]|nr:serine/threonine protein kinase [Rhodocyclales bacterium]
MGVQSGDSDGKTGAAGSPAEGGVALPHDHPDTEPTCIDPQAPIHQGVEAIAVSGQPSTANRVALPPGHKLLEYTIEAVLGAGGFGITYLASDTNLRCEVAIKEYLPGDLAVRTPEMQVAPRLGSDIQAFRFGLKRFVAESRALAGFRHPNIVRVLRFFEANDTAYMVMEYERGEALRDWIKRHSSLSEALMLRMFLPLLEGLDVVHRAGMLHRDIKPANIYVRESDGSLVLLDFGAACHVGDGSSRSMTSIVTPGFAPIEQYHTHGALGPWSDLYALGAVLYWAVTGERPLEAPARMKEDPMAPAARKGAGRYSARFLQAIDWALTPDEADRPKSVSQLQAVLTGNAAVPVGGGAVVVASPAAPEKISRLRLALAAVGIAILLTIGGLAMFLKSDPPASSPAASSAPAKSAGTTGTAGSAAPARKEQKEQKPAYVIFDVSPAGEIILNGKKAGSSPPLTRLKLAPGEKHKIEIHGAGLSHYWTVILEPGETRTIRANFSQQY